MSLRLIQKEIDFASVNVQPLDIAHPIDPDPLLYNKDG